MNRRLLAITIAALSLFACSKKEAPVPTTSEPVAKPAPAAVEEKVLNVYNWSDYIAPETIAKFQKETGITITYDEMDSNDTLESKILAGDTGYDIVVPGSAYLGRQIQAGAYQTLDKSQLSNWKNLDPDLLSKLAKVDPDNAHAMPYMWGTTGIGYNVDKIKALFGNTDVVNSWDLIFNPDNLKKLHRCGVTFLDAPSEIIPTTLYAMGEEPNSFDPAVIDKAAAKLASLRPYIDNFHSSEYIESLASGNICIVVGWSGDVIQAKARAAEAKNGVNIGYSVPTKGAAMWFDMMAIPKTAKHPKNAHLFLNFLMRPEIIAEVTNFVSYPNANAAATALVDKSISEDPMISPSKETIATKLYGLAVLPPDILKKYTAVWTTLKTSN